MAYLIKRLFPLLFTSLLILSPLANAQEVQPININSATAEQLSEGLVGIGPKKAEAIIAYRNANGGFVSVEELLEIKGIGSATLDKNRNLIVLE